MTKVRMHKTPQMKILPVHYPMITTYTQHAHLLSILTNYDFTKCWIYSNYIQLYINRNYKHNWGDFYFPFPYELRPSDTCKWIISQKINRDIAIKRWGSLFNFIIDCINSDNYIHTMLNYFYVPLSPRYNKDHLCHDMFIYGYNLHKKVFHVADFFRFGKYSFETISFSDFSQAFFSNNLAKNQDYLNGLIYLYHMNRTCDYKFHVRNITNSIHSYLNSTEPEYWYAYNNENKDDIVFNREIYDSLKNYVTERLASRADVDIRPFYLLYDHKKMMSLRIQFLCEQKFYENNHQNISQLNELEERAVTLLNIVIKYNITKDNQCKNKIITLLDYINNKEYGILQHYTD